MFKVPSYIDANCKECVFCTIKVTVREKLIKAIELEKRVRCMKGLWDIILRDGKTIKERYISINLFNRYDHEPIDSIGSCSEFTKFDPALLKSVLSKKMDQGYLF